MINHVRTLLLNRRAAEMDDVVGSEYIGDYFPVTLPTNLDSIRRAFYPTELDLFGEHEVTARLMQVLHQPELDTVTRSFDPRTTYQLADETIAKALTNPLTVTRFKDSACDMTLHYVLSPDYTAARLTSGHHVWHLSSGNVESISIRHNDGPAELYDVVPRHVTVTEHIVLVRDYLSVYFDIPSSELTGTYRFTLDLMVPVQYNYSTVLERLEAVMARTGGESLLFDGTWEHLPVLLDTWHDSPETLLRLGAVALALAYQMDVLRGLR